MNPMPLDDSRRLQAMPAFTCSMIRLIGKSNKQSEPKRLRTSLDIGAAVPGEFDNQPFVTSDLDYLLIYSAELSCKQYVSATCAGKITVRRA